MASSNRDFADQNDTGAAGRVADQTVIVAPGATVLLPDVDLDGAHLALLGDDLLVTMSDGSTLMIEDLVPASASDDPPSFEFAGHTTLSDTDLIATAAAQTATAAGGGDGGVGIDDDGTTVAPAVQGGLGDTSDPLGVLDPTALHFDTPATKVTTSFVTGGDEAFGFVAPEGGSGNGGVQDGDGGDDDCGDVPAGNDGDDVLSGGNGDDVLSGGAGNDTLYGGNGEDRLFGGAGQDGLYGENGADFLCGGADEDTLYGGHGDDILSGRSGDDLLFGGKGSDTLTGGGGDDIMTGGNGDDTFVWNADDHGTVAVPENDVITDFEISLHLNVTDDGVTVDSIDAKDVLDLSGLVGGSENLDDDHIQITRVGYDMVISVDHDGGGTFAGTSTITLEGVNFEGASLQQLLDAGVII